MSEGARCHVEEAREQIARLRASLRNAERVLKKLEEDEHTWQREGDARTLHYAALCVMDYARAFSQHVDVVLRAWLERR